jgi:DNA polymerase
MVRERSAPISEPAAPAPTATGASPSEPMGVNARTVDAGVRLRLLAEDVRSCTRCGLHATRTQTVFARGSDKSGVCFIGEGPGADEDAKGFPFVGAAGQLLDKMIAGMGLGRDDVYVCNIVKCRPP